MADHFEQNERTVIIAEDHPLFLRGLIETVTSCPGWVVAATTGDGAELPALVEKHQPTVVLLDLKLPRMSGWKLIDHLGTDRDSPAIVLVTSFLHPLVLTLARHRQVAGLVSKEDDPAMLLTALKRAEQEIFYASQAFLDQADTGSEPPSQRESEVLLAIAEGATGKEIASRLGLNHKTVETYRMRLMRKLGCNNAADLTRVAVECGLI